MAEIEKKIWPASFELIRSGKKTYEVRLADWKVEYGDILVLREWDPQTKTYSGRKLRKKVGYVGSSDVTPYWPKEEIDKYGLNIISLLDE